MFPLFSFGKQKLKHPDMQVTSFCHMLSFKVSHSVSSLNYQWPKALSRPRHHAAPAPQLGCYHSQLRLPRILDAHTSRYVSLFRHDDGSILNLALDFAELNAPPMINYGVVYPQAILMFVITMLYSVVQPLIVIFGAIYFGVGYVVYKYKLLFGAFESLESPRST